MPTTRMNLENRTVAVTGASGMLGAYICRALRASGARVRGVVRNLDKARFLEREGVELARADLAERDALTAAFRGCDAVVSNAALYNLLNLRWSDNYRANLEGTENVYEACAAAGASRVVHISSWGVNRWHLGPPAIDDATPLLDGERRKGGAYRATKALSEIAAFRVSRERGLATTALRPGGIYGARDKNLMPYFRLWMAPPVAFVPKLRFPFVYAGDVAASVVGALRNDASAGQAYLVAGRDETVYDFARAWLEAADRRAVLVPIPVGTGIHSDSSRAAREIGFANRSYVDGLRETFAADRAERAGAS
ncbi:MAG TPA: NAD-dependent epimerase/dehydratase family protein [Polyangiaceae bacterium]|nr:NAD-dependent epimerase/dehydratase family protein [Polyangiaceae bacterium]